MFFYIDEAGHTGTNLFDNSQPYFYYGVLGCKKNLDVLAQDLLTKARKRLGVKRLHANELGVGRIIEIADILSLIQKKFRPVFDFYSVKKADHVLFNFFDQVFDQGLNKAVPWSTYWTPMRYIMLFKLAYLFCEDTAKMAWEARLELNNKKAEEILIALCDILLSRVHELPDERSRIIISDGLKWARDFPHEISYNCSTRSEKLQISPNIIGFQSVLFGIKRRLQNLKNLKIVVDQQSQFNKAQEIIAKIYEKAPRDKKIKVIAGIEEQNFVNMPTSSHLFFCDSNNSCGLELVDIYLWIFKRFLLDNKSELPYELYSIINAQIKQGQYEEISLDGIEKRWGNYFDNLPAVSEDKRKEAEELLAKQEKIRIEAVNESYKKIK